MNAIAQHGGGEFTVVLFRVEVQLRRGSNVPKQDVAKLLTAQGFRALDLFRARARHTEEALCVVDGIHLTILGHPVVADAIFTLLPA
jgi:hypothetical protein